MTFFQKTVKMVTSVDNIQKKALFNTLKQLKYPNIEKFTVKDACVWLHQQNHSSLEVSIAHVALSVLQAKAAKETLDLELDKYGFLTTTVGKSIVKLPTA